MLLASSALALGFLHGLGADHLMAVAALSVGGGANPVRGRAFGVAVRFACGHAALLAAGACAVVLAGWQVPVTVERGGEMAAGLLLVGLGAVGALGGPDRPGLRPCSPPRHAAARRLALARGRAASSSGLHPALAPPHDPRRRLRCLRPSGLDAPRAVRRRRDGERLVRDAAGPRRDLRVRHPAGDGPVRCRAGARDVQPGAGRPGALGRRGDCRGVGRSRPLLDRRGVKGVILRMAASQMVVVISPSRCVSKLIFTIIDRNDYERRFLHNSLTPWLRRRK